VPNKEFITGRVLNWTLSDTQTRLFINIGIAYGSDVRKARELILQAATEAEHVLDEPKPSVTFATFGDNALQLELRCYLPSIDYNLVTKTELHDAIYEKFDKAGIVLAFPQRDVHLNTTSPLEVRMRRD
jgi:potassium efflux system protein